MTEKNSSSLLTSTLTSTSTSSIFFNKLALVIITFFAGAAIMIIEMAANRILSPWFGNSLYTWTALIGIILVALSIGSYLGGYFADRKPYFKFLGHILVLSSITTILIPWLQKLMEGMFDDAHIIWGPVVATLILFSIPAIILGQVSPFVVRLTSMIKKDSEVGFSAGMMGMFSTLGSVFGTFLAGMYLIPNYNINSIFYTVAVILCLMAILCYWFDQKIKAITGGQNLQGVKKWAAMIIATLLPVVFTVMIYLLNQHNAKIENLIYEKNTFYHRIRVFAYEMRNGDTLKSIQLDTTSEGAQFEKSKEIPIEYQKYWELIKAWKPHLQKAAFLGGGGFAMPVAVKEYYPTSLVEVIEIDPEVIEVGKKYFRMSDDNAPVAYADDARRFLKNADGNYDFIFGDTYNGIRYIPAHLVTKEFFQLVKSKLNQDGIYMINLISSIRGEKSELFQAVMKTLNEVFQHTYVFAVSSSNLSSSQNLIIVASPHQALDFTQQISLENLVDQNEYNFQHGILITDSYNPIESIVAKALLID